MLSLALAATSQLLGTLVLANAASDWGALLIGISSVLTGIAAVIAAVNSGHARRWAKAVHHQVKPPSNGRTLGDLVENQSVVQHVLVKDYVDRLEAGGHTAPLFPPFPPGHG